MLKSGNIFPMNNLIVSVLLLLGAHAVVGQDIISAELHQIELTFRQDGDNLSLHFESPEGKHLFLKDCQLKLEGADLIIDFQSERQLKDHQYQLSIWCLDPFDNIIFPSKHRLEGPTTIETGISEKLIWRNFTEQVLWLDKPMKLNIRTHLYGSLAIKCSDGLPPKPLSDSLMRKIYLTGAILGIGLSSYGLAKRVVAKRAYANYNEKWKTSRPAAEAVDDLKKATDNNSTFKAWTTIGIGILGLTSIVYAENLRIHLRKRKLYRKYCDRTTAILLSPSFNSTPLGSVSMGASLTVRF